MKSLINSASLLKSTMQKIKQKDLESIKKKILPILREYGVTKAGIFGSYARGENRKRSDVDILIKIDEGADLITLIRLRRMLREAVRRRVDIVEYETIRRELKKQILNDEIKIL